MAVKRLQRSFAGGEVSPEVYGRVDLGHIQTALAIARNVITSQHGPAFNRAGFKYILETKDSTKESVLLPFSFNDEQTYILEFGDQYIRFHTGGGTLLEASQNITGITQPAGVVTIVGHGYSNGQWLYLAGIGGMTQLNGRYIVVSDAAADTFRMKDFAGSYITTGDYGAYTAGGTAARVYEIASPYLEADLFELHIAQSADVLTITHPNYAPRELSRLAAASWTLAEVAFTNGPVLDDNTDPVNYAYLSTLTVVAGGYTIPLIMQKDTFTAADVGRLVRLDSAPYDSTYTTPWEVGKVVAINAFRENDGKIYRAATAGTTGAIAPTHDRGQKSDGDPGVVWLFYGPTSIFVEITAYTNARQVTVFVPFAKPGDGLHPPSLTGGPTTLLTGPHTLSGDGVTKTFSCVGITRTDPSLYKVEVDSVLQLPTFYYSVDAAADTITFVSAPPVGVNNVVVREYQYMLWTASWALGAWGETPGYPGAVSYFGGRLAYGGSDEEPQNVWLSRSRRYKDLGTTIDLADDEAIDLVFADRQVNRVRDLVALKHLVALTSSRTWHLVGDADNVLTPTATADPGDAVGISTVQAEVAGSHGLYVDAVGNAIHRLYYGALPTGESGYLSEDLSILAEHLTRNKTIVDIAFQRKPVPILWCVRSDGYLLGLTYNARHEVVGWHQHTTDGEFESVAVVNEGTEDVLYAIIKRTINGRTVRYVERMASRRFVTLADCFFVDAGLSYDGAAADEITGLWHLEGETVVGLMDGAVFSKVVTDGTITLDAEASKVHAGLGYVADMQSLPLSIEMRDVGASGQGTTKNVNAVHLRLIDSSGVKAGPDEDHLDELLQREDEVYGSAPNVVNGLHRVPIDGTWTDDGQVYIRQENPLPLHVSQLVIEVTLGG